MIQLVLLIGLHLPAPSAKALFNQCYYPNAQGLTPLQPKTKRDVRNYCRCRTKELLRLYKHTPKIAPKVVFDYYLIQVHKRCAPTHRI